MPTDDVNNDINVVKEQLYPFIPLYPENTDLETRYNYKRNLCVTASGNVMDIPRKTGDDHEIVLSPYNSERFQNIYMTFMSIIIFLLMSLMPNNPYTEHALLYDLF